MKTDTASHHNKPIKVFLTGATGVMGTAGLKQLTADSGNYDVTALVRDTKVNRKKMLPFQKKGVNVIWGDLTDYNDVVKGIDDAEIILHVGGMVSPKADWYPEKTIEVNVAAMRNIVEAVKSYAKSHPDKTEPKVVYIGSVAQYGNRAIPEHWGGVGDPLTPAVFDAYAYSKIEAERILAESGLKRWVSLRQTGILHPGLLMKASDPISFHVPIRGVLEWVSVDDSGRLLEKVCHRDVPQQFWCDFYNIGGGESYRMTNYEFEKRLLAAIGCPPPEKVFEPSWFATKNFHGMWYYDSDRLENFLHYRSGETSDDYFKRMVASLPLYFKLTPIAPAFIIKAVMKRVAHTPKLGTLWWVKNNIEPRIKAAFGSNEERERIKGWDTLDLTIPSKKVPEHESDSYHTDLCSYQNHGNYHKNVYADRVSFDNVSLISEYNGDYKALLKWKCLEGHEFEASMMLVERGGHRCPHCIKSNAVYT